MKRVTTILPALAFFLSGILSAQSNHPKYVFGLNLGFTVYQGDLTPERLGAFKTQKLSAGIHASRLLSSSFAVRGNLTRGRLKGDDARYDQPEFRQQRNFNFTSPLTELSVQLLWNPAGRNYTDKGYSPYLFAGAGFAFLHIRRDWSRFNPSYFGVESADLFPGLAADTAHSLPRVIPVIPVGAGINYFFNSRLGANAETSYRLAYTDYIDGFSQSANPRRKDHYLQYSVGILYRTGKTDPLKCPVIRY
ncbi:MAG: hypothetical protein HYZ15_00920 [Sphingobacteriales bacterium]|nr:hypothetical protein [Sphingobacteriales bacterium]